MYAKENPFFFQVILNPIRDKINVKKFIPDKPPKSDNKSGINC